MNGYLLDTNVISEFRKLRPHGAVVAWVKQNRNLYLSAVSVGELQSGIERTRKQDPEKAAALEHWLDSLPAVYEVLPMDGACFREWARLMEGQPHSVLQDAMIAATARVHGLTVATRDRKDFSRLGVAVLNPFDTR